MEWLTDNAKKEKRSMETTPSSVPIDTHIRLAREKLEKEKEEIPQLEEEINSLLERIQSFGSKRHQLRRKLDAEDRIDLLRRRIRRLDTNEHITEYDHKMLPFLEAYMKKSNANIGDRETKRRNISLPGEIRIERIDGYVQTNSANQSTIVSEYLADVCKEAPRMDLEKRDLCPNCNEEMLLVPTKSVITCTKCGYSASYLDATTSSISYGDEVEFASFSYKRINHFNEWLQQVQAKETMEISQEVINKVMEEIYRQRITDVELITHKKIREVLKTLKLRKTYEHVAQIASRITGKAPPRMSPETEELCRLMFIAVQPAFEKTLSYGSEELPFLFLLLVQVSTAIGMRGISRQFYPSERARQTSTAGRHFRKNMPGIGVGIYI